MALRVGLQFDPWSDEDGLALSEADRSRLKSLGAPGCRRVGDGTAWLEQQALLLCRRLLQNDGNSDLAVAFRMWSAEAADLQQLPRSKAAWA